MDQLLVNLKLLDRWDYDLSGLQNYVQLVSDSVGHPIPNTYPIFGADAFRTATGVHAAAIRKAQNSGIEHLADVVYSGVPAHLFGLQQEIEIGRMSGKSNVLCWLERHDVSPTPAIIKGLLDVAHQSRSVLTTDEILNIIKEHI